MARSGGPPPNIYDGHTFPDYKYREYPKQILHPGTRQPVIVADLKEELAVLSHVAEDELTEAETERDQLAIRLAETQAQLAAHTEELERLRLETGKTVVITPGGVEAVSRQPGEVERGIKPANYAGPQPVQTAPAAVPSNAQDGAARPSSRLTANLKDGKNEQGQH